MLPFLVTRQIFAGAGKMGVERESAGRQPGIYQISQRADFFSVLVSIDTMNRRPLVNTRDEPHADAERYRRFHVIIGDANMSEFATALKIGTTALVLDLIERGEAPQLELAHPIDGDQVDQPRSSCDWIVELQDGRKISAIDIQRLYLAAARDQRSDATKISGCWRMGEGAGRSDAIRCRARPARLGGEEILAQTLQQEEGLDWSDPWLQSIDLEYHNVELEQGLYYELEREGQIRRMVARSRSSTRSLRRRRRRALFSAGGPWRVLTKISIDPVGRNRFYKRHVFISRRPARSRHG